MAPSISHPKEGAKIKQNAIVAYGKTDSLAGINVYLSLAGETKVRYAPVFYRVINATLGSIKVKWWSSFSNLTFGAHTLHYGTPKTNDEQQISFTTRGRSRIRPSGSFAIQRVDLAIEPLGLIEPVNAEVFDPDFFIAYGLLEPGDNYILDATMTNHAGGAAQHAQVFNDPSGFWFAMFDPITVGANPETFDFDAVGDVNGSGLYGATGLTHP